VADEYLAIDLQRITEGMQKWAPGTRQPCPPYIPTISLSPARVTPAEAAIVSWRWDIDPVERTSRNISVAIRHAQQIGLKYLFVDLVSVDNALHGTELIRNVLKFTALYRSLPVIAAYDEIGSLMWHLVLRRPWIAHEIRACLSNSQGVHYVGHVPEQGAKNYRRLVENIWSTEFANSILYVLSGRTGMTDVTDFRFIMPDYTLLVDIIHRSMSRSDYLLTLAILDQVHARKDRLNGDQDITGVKFDRYRLAEPVRGVARELRQDILLDGKKVATWSSDDGSNISTRIKMPVEPDVVQTIFIALGLSQAHYLQYAADWKRQSTRLTTTIAPAVTVYLARDDKIEIVEPKDSYEAKMPRAPGSFR
jgi:hypothetical protein